MKCLFVGVFNEKSTNFSQARCLKEVGCEVEEFGYRGLAANMGNSGRDIKLRVLLDKGDYDFVLIAKGNSIDSKVFFNCGTKTILWYPDPMNGNWNDELIEKIKICHVTICALYRPYVEARKYTKNSCFLEEGFDPVVDHPISVDKIMNVTFIGNMDDHRRGYLDAHNFDIISAWKEDHAKVVGQSRINLNFVRSESGCSDRVYKVLAAGGFLLTEPWPDMDGNFKVGEDFDIFRDKKEFREKIEYYLGKPDRRKEISDHGVQTVQKFSRVEWARGILKIVEGLKCES